MHNVFHFEWESVNVWKLKGKIVLLTPKYLHQLIVLLLTLFERESQCNGVRFTGGDITKQHLARAFENLW